MCIQAAAENWFQAPAGRRERQEDPVAEASAFSRGLIRSGLDMAGYRVFEAANLEEAIRGLEQQPVDVVVAALDLPPDGSSALLAAMRAAAGVGGDPGPGAGRFGRADPGIGGPDGGLPGLPDEVRPRGDARVGGAAGVGAGCRPKRRRSCAGEER